MLSHGCGIFGSRNELLVVGVNEKRFTRNFCLIPFASVWPIGSYSRDRQSKVRDRSCALVSKRAILGPLQKHIMKG